MTSLVETRSVELAIGGMTCAACAARVERTLNKLDGVSARVNFATERATVEAVVPIERLVEQVEAAGYTATPLRRDDADPADREAAERVRSLWWRLVVALLVGVPMADLSFTLALVPSLRFPGWPWVVLALTLPVVGWCAWPFHHKAVAAARHGGSSMDTLVSLGIIAATCWSVYTMFWHGAASQPADGIWGLVLRPGGSIYLDVAVGVTIFVLAGRLFEAKAKRTAGGALRALAALGTKDVAVLGADGAERRVPVDELRVGEEFVVRPGETIATDGEVTDGACAVDASSMTGESIPTETGPGDPVAGGTVALGGRLVVHATRVGADTQLAQLVRLVERAQGEKAAVQRLADRVSGVFVPVVVRVTGGALREQVLRQAGAVEHASEHASEHVIAHAIAAAARAECGELPAITGFRALPGLGAQGMVDGGDVLVGSVRLLADHGIALPTDLADTREEWEAAGRTCVGVARDGVAVGLIAVADTVRPHAAQAVGDLHALGLRTVLLTGDNTATARAVAAEAGIDDVVAEVLPADKAAAIERLQAEGRGAVRDPARPRHPAHHPRQPVVGLRLQHRRPAGRRPRTPQPACRGRGDGVLLAVRGVQQPAATAVQRRAMTSSRAASMPLTETGHANSSARARAAARRKSSGRASSPVTADANAGAASATAAPQPGCTISRSAEEAETTTGVPEASASSAASPNVSCGPGARETSALARRRATVRRSDRKPRKVTGRPRARRSSARRRGPSPAITSRTAAPDSVSAATVSTLRSTCFSGDKRPQWTISASAPPASARRQPSSRLAGAKVARSTPSGTRCTLGAPIRSNSSRAKAVVQTTLS